MQKRIICRDWLFDLKARELAAHKAQIKDDFKWCVGKLLAIAQCVIVGVAIGIVITI